MSDAIFAFKFLPILIYLRRILSNGDVRDTSFWRFDLG